jgi:hypothetical protein
MTVGLHALFFTKTRLLSQPGDVGCYVTPSEWADNRSGRVIRDLFLNGLGGESLLLLDPQTFTFAGVKTTAAISTFVISKESTTRRLATNVSVATLGAGIEKLGEVIPRTALTTSRGWSRVMNNPAGMPDTGPTLGDLFHVHRGTATGANAFWTMTPADAKVRGLSDFGVPTATRAKEIIDAEGVLRKRPDHKVVLSFPKILDRKDARAVDEYLRTGERPDGVGLVVCEGSNARKRTPWWSITVTRPAIVATYMSRRPPSFAANPDRLGILNIAIALDPKIEMDSATIARVVEALNEGASSFEEYAVRYFGNLRKFEPTVVAMLPLPAALHYLMRPASTVRA